MKEIGQILKSEREKKSLSYEQVYEEIKIQKKYLVAIEEGDESAFVARVYYMSFMKAYAKYLGLDFEEIYKDYEIRKIKNEELKKAAQKNTQDSHKNSVFRRYIEQIKEKKALILCIIIVILLILVVYLYTNSNRTIIVQEDEVIETYDSQSSPKTPTPPQSLPQTVTIPKVETVSESLARSTAAASLPQASKPVAPAQQLPDNIRKDIDIDAVAASRNAEKQILNITVNNADQVWISVEADGKKIYSDGVTLSRGQSLSWEASNSFRVIIGYARGVKVTFNGIEVDVLKNAKQDVSVINLRKS
ncbi:MAG: DUF4115 domain-containing protein [Endomicrobium sp.]|jgi:cytoskeletal protein RodZ|nr:DUF4115 domain-containing protein [Endomicrobium sp.]